MSELAAAASGCAVRRYAADVCGIAGKVTLGEPVDPALIERMCDVIEHRGPDSRGTFVEGRVGLGVQRLAVIDLATGDQPISNEDGSVVVVLNGEIYNYVELRQSLAERGHVFATNSDTEVLVHLYEDHGAELVQMLRGMFAFALWDRPRGRLLLARDRLGKKPLYYAFDGSRLWFASEAKSILQDPGVAREVEPAAIDAFLQYRYVPAPLSAFRALSVLRPAHTLLFESDGRLRETRYWKLSYHDRLRLDEDDACELIREQLLDATRVRLRSDVPLGIFLSGGVDSSAVVAAAARVSERRLQTFTIGFSSEEFDERRHARTVAAMYDTDHHELVVEPDVVEVLPRLAWHYGEPFADHSAVPSFYLAALTRQHVTVALNGDGGDESFGGYRRYVGNDLAARIDLMPAAVAHAVERALGRWGTGANQDGRRARLLRVARTAGADPADRYARWIACFDGAERRALYTAGFAAQVGTADADEVVRAPFRASDASTLIERLLDVDVQTYLPGQLLVKMDIASMAHSLEVRSPLLDHHFVELAARLPLTAKVSGGTGKRLLKKAVAPWLPRDLPERPKQGFAMPVARWLRAELRDLPRALLLDDTARARELFRLPAVERLISDHHRGIADNTNRLWALMQLELWFRTYVDVPPRAPLTLDVAELVGRS
jgi:asparagine synthase (glutamine-hydrolysing)